MQGVFVPSMLEMFWNHEAHPGWHTNISMYEACIASKFYIALSVLKHSPYTFYTHSEVEAEVEAARPVVFVKSSDAPEAPQVLHQTHAKMLDKLSKPLVCYYFIL